VRRRHAHLLVDEYQDTDPAQQRLLDAWLGDSRSLCVVGDPNQSIYGFKGAEPGLIEIFTGRFPDAVTVALVRDYRSTPQVVAVANRIVAAPAATALVGQQPAGQEPSLTVHQEQEEETVAVVERVRGLLAEGLPVNQIAILHRYHVQGDPIRAALLGAGLPVVRLKDDERFSRTRQYAPRYESWLEPTPTWMPWRRCKKPYGSRVSAPSIRRPRGCSLIDMRCWLRCCNSRAACQWSDARRRTLYSRS